MAGLTESWGVLGAVCCLLLPRGSAAQVGTVSEQYLLAAANQDRVARHLPPVRIDLLLSAAALAHARQMMGHGTISHQFAGEPDLAARAGRAGVRFSLITENVAEASNSALIHDMWMKSAGHRANLLDPAVDTIGIAVVADRGQLYAVEDFARTVRNLGLREQETQVGDLVAGTGVEVLPEVADARQTCQLKTGYVGSRQPWFVMRYTASDLGRLPQELTTKLGSGKYRQAAIGACTSARQAPFTSYEIAVLLYP
jgi:hypothetical protein